MTAGKTTLAMYLEQEHGFKKVSFADPIKKLEAIQANVHPNSWKAELEKYMDEHFPFIKDQNTYIRFFDEIFSKNEVMPGKKNRSLLQDIGHGARNLYGNIWIDYALNVANKHQGKVVIDDVRYFNEVEILKANGFNIWRIEVNPKIQEERIKQLYGIASLAHVNHESEQQCDNLWEYFDYVIDGNVDVVEMCESADYIIEQTKEKMLKALDNHIRRLRNV